MGRQQQGILAGCRLRNPSSVSAQHLLDPPWPEDPEPDLAASLPNGLTNRRVRARMSGGGRGGGATPPPTRSPPSRRRGRVCRNGDEQGEPLQEAPQFGVPVRSCVCLRYAETSRHPAGTAVHSESSAGEGHAPAGSQAPSLILPCTLSTTSITFRGRGARSGRRILRRSAPPDRVVGILLQCADTRCCC
jgi:hypothetical protein